MENDDPYGAPIAQKQPAMRKRIWKFGLPEGLATIFVIVVLVALLLPAVSTPRGVGRRMSCKNKMKQLGLALHNYHDVYGSFPPAAVHNTDGVAIHSWRVLLLPFLEQQKLYDQYDFDEPWNGPHNITLQDSMPDAFRCPESVDFAEMGTLLRKQLNRMTSYVLVISPDGLFYDNRAPTLHEVSDGTFQTMMTAEARQHSVHWMAPDDITPTELLSDLRWRADSSEKYHKGLHIGMVDGSVRWLPSDVSETTLTALVSANGGDELPEEF